MGAVVCSLKLKQGHGGGNCLLVMRNAPFTKRGGNGERSDEEKTSQCLFFLLPDNCPLGVSVILDSRLNRAMQKVLHKKQLF